MTMFSKLAIFAAAATEVDAAVIGGVMCADAPDWKTVKLAFAGDKSKCSATAFPSTYLQQELYGMALVTGANKADYITKANNATMLPIDASTGVGDGSLGANKKIHVFKEDAAADIPVANGGPGKSAYRMVGTAVGTIAAGGQYGFIGTASYFITEGTGTLTKNNFCGPDTKLASTECSEICAIKLEGGKCPTAGRKVKAGDYKFALYGYTAGTNFATFISQQKNPQALGIRKDMKYVGFTNLKFTPKTSDAATNGKEMTYAEIPAKGLLGVTEIFFKSDEAQFTMTFEQDYNVGKASDCANGKCPDSGLTSKKVTVNVVKKAGSTDTIHADYLFDIADLNTAGKFFVYDPALATAAAGGSKPTPGGAATTGGTTTGTKTTGGTAAASGAFTAGVSASVMAAVMGFLMM